MNKYEKKRQHRYTKIKRVRRARNLSLAANAILTAVLMVVMIL